MSASASTREGAFGGFDGQFLAALAPRGHRALRAVYDRFGPRLAARVTPRGATLLHLAFKPAELGVALVLRILLRNPEDLLGATYR